MIGCWKTMANYNTFVAETNFNKQKVNLKFVTDGSPFVYFAKHFVISPIGQELTIKKITEVDDDAANFETKELA